MARVAFDPLRTEILPVLAVAETVLYPGMCSSVTLTSVAAYGAAREAVRASAAPRLGVFTATARHPGAALFTVGALAEATNLRRLASGHWGVDVRAIGRARRHALLRSEPFRVAPVELLPDPDEDLAALTPVIASIRLAVRAARDAHPCAPLVEDRLRGALPAELPAIVSPILGNTSVRDRQDILEADALAERLALLLAHLHAVGQARQRS